MSDVSSQDAVFDIIRRESEFSDLILDFLEQFRSFFYRILYPQGDNAVNDDRVVQVNPESQLFLPAYETGRVKVL